MLESFVFSTRTRLNIFHSFFKVGGNGILFFYYFFQHMLRINPGNTWKVLGCCDGLISWHRGTAHGLAPQGVTEWLLVTNMEKFQVPLHGCKQAANLPWQVSKEKNRKSGLQQVAHRLWRRVWVSKKCENYLGCSRRWQGRGHPAKDAEKWRVFISRAWEEEGKMGERGKNWDVKKKSSEVMPE